MHENAMIRSGARRCLDSGGPTITIGRTDRWSGSQMVNPEIYGLATLVSGHDDREGKEAEDKLVRDAFAAFRQVYVAGLRELVGDEQPAVEAEARPARRASPEWPLATTVPDATPLSKPLASAEVI